MSRPVRRRRRRPGRRGVSEVIATILLVLITVVLMLLVYMIRFPLTPAPPNVTYQVNTGASRPVWGDPTDCYPNLPNPPSYYLGPHKSYSLYNTYMYAWWVDCEFGNTGTYNSMNVSEIQITGVSASIPLADIEFQFVCTNTTPRYIQTDFVQGPLDAMEWVPGSSQSLSPQAPVLKSCATYDPNQVYRGAANSIYYNRLGYFDPVDSQSNYLSPKQTIVIYVHTPNSVLEAPNPIEPVRAWNVSDGDDYHGAPPWCFTVPGACTVNLLDTQWNPAVILVSVPLYIV